MHLHVRANYYLHLQTLNLKLKKKDERQEIAPHSPQELYKLKILTHHF